MPNNNFKILPILRRFSTYNLIFTVLTAAISSGGSSQLLREAYVHETLSTTFHVNPSWCITLADLLVGTEQCLRTNKAIDKRNCSWRISGRVINGHPLAKQRVGTW